MFRRIIDWIHARRGRVTATLQRGEYVIQRPSLYDNRNTSILDGLNKPGEHRG